MNNNDFGSIYIWVHSSLAAFSIGYFLSLLSASSQTQQDLIIVFASVLFCISLITNAGMAFFLVWFGHSEDMINRMYSLYPWHDFKSVPSIAIMSFFSGLMFLLGFYSFWLAVLAIFTSGVIYIVIGNTYHTSMREDFDTRVREMKLGEDLDKANKNGSKGL